MADLKRLLKAPYIKPHIDVLVGVVALTVVLRALHLNLLPFFDLANIALLYLLPVLYGVIKWGRAASISSAILSVAAFDYFFVPPVLSFTVADLRYLITFLVFIIVAYITGDLASRLKDEAELAKKREERATALYSLSRKIAAESDLPRLLDTIVRAMSQAINADARILVNEEGRELLVTSNGSLELWPENTVKIPLQAKEANLGMLEIAPKPPDTNFSPEHLQLAEAFANLSAVAVLRLRLALEAREVSHIAESEKLRSALLNAISHDLRTPLASITGAATSLQEQGVYNPDSQRALVDTIKDGAMRMNNMIGNLLSSARFESGMLTLNKEWCDIQDIIGVALSSLKDTLQDRPIRIGMPSELPLVRVDFSLIEQVIVNLLYNAVNYSPPGSDISVDVVTEYDELRVSVGDRGPGVAVADRERIFDRFYRLYSTAHVRGTGLGLSICKEIVEVHGGKIWVDEASAGGSKFTFSLPLDVQPEIAEPAKLEGGEDA